MSDETRQAAIDAHIQDYAARGQARVEHPVVLAIIDRDPDHLRNLIAAGPNTYLDELLSILHLSSLSLLSTDTAGLQT